MSSRDTETENQYSIPIKYTKTLNNGHSTVSFILKIHVVNKKIKIRITKHFRILLLLTICDIKNKETKDFIKSLRNNILSVNEIKRLLLPYFEKESKDSLKMFEEITNDLLSRRNLKKKILQYHKDAYELESCALIYEIACDTFLNKLDDFESKYRKKRFEVLDDFPDSSHHRITKLMSKEFIKKK